MMIPYKDYVLPYRELLVFARAAAQELNVDPRALNGIMTQLKNNPAVRQELQKLD